MSNWHNMDIIKNTHTIRIQLVPLLFCHTSSISCFVTNRGHSHAARNILSWPRGDASHWGQQALVSYSPAMSNLGALPLTTSTKFLCYNPLPVCLSKSQAYFAAFPWFLGTHFWFGCHILKPLTSLRRRRAPSWRRPAVSWRPSDALRLHRGAPRPPPPLPLLRRCCGSAPWRQPDEDFLLPRPGRIYFKQNAKR